MRLGGRLSAAAEVLEDIFKHYLPVSRALLDWAKTHRFCGSSDRRAIGDLVYDVLRKKHFLSTKMGSDQPRALVLAAARFLWEIPLPQLLLECSAPFGLGELTALECKALEGEGRLSSQDPWILGNYPEWLHPFWGRAFGEQAVLVAESLCARAPVDIRVNTLKTSVDKTLRALSRFSIKKAPLSPWGARVEAPPPMKGFPNLEADLHFQKGWFELQDVASQVASFLLDAEPGMQVLDLCAGAGGKTLALAATMANRGQIFAYDQDPHRLKPVIERLRRAGARNVQVIDSKAFERLEALEGVCDRVFVDAPCSGTGAWRRRPDHKWRLREESLAKVCLQQKEILRKACTFVKPGGRMLYATCSLLQEENEDQVLSFLTERSDFYLLDVQAIWRKTIDENPPQTLSSLGETLTLTPFHHGCDGFFVAVLQRQGGV